MKTFQINEHLQIVCEYKKTRNGFLHRAHLFRDGREVGVKRVSYLNRTWERYEYDTVIHELLDKKGLVSPEEKQLILERVEAINKGQSADFFKPIAAVAAMGALFTDNLKEQNDWRKRMFAAGVPGLDFPDNWDSLSEEEKKRRLDGVEGVMKGITE